MASVSIASLREALARSWSLDSSSLWQQDNPALGQCGVTALVVNDQLGGEILKTKFGDIWHFYNLIDNAPVDFTESQFETPLDYTHESSDRNEAFADTNAEQYAYLRSAVRNNLERP